MNRLVVINVICLGICFFVAVKAQNEQNGTTINGVDGATNKTKTDVTLRCDITASGTLSWYHGDKLIKDGDKYEVDAGNHTLTVKKVVEGDEGEYVCNLKLGNSEDYNTTVTLFLTPQVHPFPKSRNIIQGDPLQMDCKAYGWPVPTISWWKDDKPLDLTDERVKLSNYTTEEDVMLINATLRINNLDFEDRAEYSCVASFGDNEKNATVLVRVKDKLAALWPFLGICAEVAILCVIIFIYEKRRAKKMEEEERREEADHLTNSHAHRGNDDIRQRK